MRAQNTMIWDGMAEAIEVAKRWGLCKKHTFELIARLNAAYNKGANDVAAYFNLLGDRPEKTLDRFPREFSPQK